jgi:hypothetical protein
MSRRRSVTTAFAVMLFAAPLAAQGATQAPVAVDQAVAVAPAPVVATVEVAPVSQAPTTANASVGIQRVSSSVDVNAAAPVPQGSVGRNPAMMIVGGVALIAGAVIGGESGTIIMIGGGILGLYGLWQYLK